MKYIGLLLGFPLTMMALALSVASTEWFLFHDDYFMLRNIGYSLSLNHANCQVVLTGDSSALTGLDPETVTSKTGLSACNIAEGGTITVVAGSYPIDTYLKRNAPPKYLIFMFTPSMFRPLRSWQRDSASYYEGLVYLLHYERGSGRFLKLLAHPYQTISFSLWVAHSIVSDTLRRLKDPHKFDGVEDPAMRRQRHNGLFTFYSDPETHCFRNGWDKLSIVKTDPEWIEGLRRKYGVNGTRVIVNVAPVADCDDMKEVYARDLNGLHDNNFEVLPINMFNNQDVHFSLEGAKRVSAGVADQILADEKTHFSRP